MVMTQLDLLTKHIMKDPPKAINDVDSKITRAYDDEKLEKLDKEI